MKYLTLILLSLFFISCNQKPGENKNYLAEIHKDSLQKILINVDKSWSDSAQRKGYYKSRLDFAADNAIDLLDKEMPLIGKMAISEFVASHPDSSFTIQWKALKAVVSASGDLGCTFGSWTLKTKTKSGADTTLYGDYMTVWQKQMDNSWKYILDGGNETPGEVKE